MSKEIFVLDTCSVGEFCKDTTFKLEQLKDIELGCFSIQFDEINALPDIKKKNRLLKSLKILTPHPLSSVVAGYSKWGDAYFSSETEINYFEIIKKCQLKIYPQKPIENIIRDALIGSSCLDFNYNLITEDKRLREKLKELNPNLIFVTWEEFKTIYLINGDAYGMCKM